MAASTPCDGQGSRLGTIAVLVPILLVGLLVPLAFAPWREEVFAPVKIELLQALIGIGLLLLGVTVLVGRGPRAVFRPALDGAVLTFAAANLLAYANSADRPTSWWGIFPEYQGLTTVLTYLVGYGLARLAFTPLSGNRTPALDRLFATCTVSTGLVGGYAVLQRCGLDPLWGQADRPFATVGQPNSMAAFLVVGLPAVAATATRRGPWRWVAMTAGTLGALALLASLSRGGWLAALAIGGLGLALRRPGRRRTVLVAGIVAAVVGITALAALPSGRRAALEAGGRIAASADLRTGSTAKHLALARIGVGLTVTHPWFGLGQDVFPEYAQAYADAHLPRADADLLRPRLSESPHNALLSIGAGAGIPALLAYLAVLAAAVRHLLRGRRCGQARAVPALLMITGYVVSSLFLTPEVSSTATFWIVLGAAGSAVRACNDSTGSSSRAIAGTSSAAVRATGPAVTSGVPGSGTGR